MWCRGMTAAAQPERTRAWGGRQAVPSAQPTLPGGQVTSCVTGMVMRNCLLRETKFTPQGGRRSGASRGAWSCPRSHVARGIPPIPELERCTSHRLRCGSIILGPLSPPYIPHLLVVARAPHPTPTIIITIRDRPVTAIMHGHKFGVGCVGLVLPFWEKLQRRGEE